MPFIIYFRAKKNKTDRRLNLREALEPGVLLVTCLSLFTIWAFNSPSNILEIQPRLFFTSLGIVFSNITVSDQFACLKVHALRACFIVFVRIHIRDVYNK